MMMWALGNGIGQPERAVGLGRVGTGIRDMPRWYKNVVAGALQRDSKLRKGTFELLEVFSRRV